MISVFRFSILDLFQINKYSFIKNIKIEQKFASMNCIIAVISVYTAIKNYKAYNTYSVENISYYWNPYIIMLLLKVYYYVNTILIDNYNYKKTQIFSGFRRQKNESFK